MPFAVQLPVMEVHVMVADDQMQPARVDGVQAVADVLHRGAVADVAHDPQLVVRRQRGINRGDDGGVMYVGVARYPPSADARLLAARLTYCAAATIPCSATAWSNPALISASVMNPRNAETSGCRSACRS